MEREGGSKSSGMVEGDAPYDACIYNLVDTVSAVPPRPGVKMILPPPTFVTPEELPKIKSSSLSDQCSEDVCRFTFIL